MCVLNLSRAPPLEKQKASLTSVVTSIEVEGSVGQSEGRSQKTKPPDWLDSAGAEFGSFQKRCPRSPRVYIEAPRPPRLTHVANRCKDCKEPLLILILTSSDLLFFNRYAVLIRFIKTISSIIVLKFYYRCFFLLNSRV